jgi:hypothetical protein
MALVTAHLFDAEGENKILTVEVRSDLEYEPGEWFKTDDGGIYVVMEVRMIDSPDVELDAMWIDGPHPTTLIGGHS